MLAGMLVVEAIVAVVAVVVETVVDVNVGNAAVEEQIAVAVVVG